MLFREIRRKYKDILFLSGHQKNKKCGELHNA